MNDTVAEIISVIKNSVYDPGYETYQLFSPVDNTTITDLEQQGFTITCIHKPQNIYLAKVTDTNAFYHTLVKHGLYCYLGNIDKQILNKRFLTLAIYLIERHYKILDASFQRCHLMCLEVEKNTVKMLLWDNGAIDANCNPAKYITGFFEKYYDKN